MLLAKRVKEFKIPKVFLHPRASAGLDSHSPRIGKLSRGERKAKREQTVRLAELLDANKEELLTP